MAILQQEQEEDTSRPFLEYFENYHEFSLKTPSYLSAYYGTSAGDGDMVTCSWAGLAHGPVFAAVTLLNLSLATSRPAQPPARTLRRRRPWRPCRFLPRD